MQEYVDSLHRVNSANVEDLAFSGRGSAGGGGEYSVIDADRDDVLIFLRPGELTNGIEHRAADCHVKCALL
jgi:hypothetical protein